MKPLNQKATDVFKQLTGDLYTLGESTIIDNTNKAFMPVHVEFIHENEHGKHYSIAHYYEQNSDLMADPEMVFLLSVNDKQVYPLTFRQDGFPPVDQTAATADDDEPIKCNQKLQRDIATFANTWMRNIKEQQGLDGGHHGRAIVV